VKHQRNRFVEVGYDVLGVLVTLKLFGSTRKFPEFQKLIDEMQGQPVRSFVEAAPVQLHQRASFVGHFFFTVCTHNNIK